MTDVIESNDLQPVVQHGLFEHAHGAGSLVPEQSRAERRTSFDVADLTAEESGEDEKPAT